ncbi:MAG TPA: GNAT family N-acetyltransferase [Galbitalea sp.]|jgi:GNAT superfamily N-acetyltransferase|nr:GNAT family N-acetyltransferase [Galbitalea sp.]
MTPIRLRPFAPRDATALTDFLHRAYAELGAEGLNFTAVDQTEATTLHRASAGLCLLAEDKGGLIGTATIALPPSATMRRMFPAADRPDMAWLGQLGVDPHRRGEGVASALWAEGLAWAVGQGATSIGVDTAIPATNLRSIYRRWGFIPAGEVHWEGKTYDSAVLLRSLP